MTRKKVRGSTLIEVIVAITITSICIALANAVVINVMNSSRSLLILKAQSCAQKEMQGVVKQRLFLSEIYEKTEFVINKNVVRHLVFKDCLTIHLNVFARDKKLLVSLSTIVKLNQNENLNEP